VTRLQAGQLWFNSQQGQGIVLFTMTSRLVLGLTEPPVQWVPGVLSPGVKWPGNEADHSLPSNAKVKNEWSYTSTLPYVIMALCVVKHRDSFTFTFAFTFPADALQYLRIGHDHFLPHPFQYIIVLILPFDATNLPM